MSNNVYRVGKQIKDIPVIAPERLEQMKKDIGKYINNNCNCCNGSTNDYTILNADTVPYSGIEIGFHNMGMLRVRYYKDADYEANFESQDITMLKVCPVCGRKLDNV